MATFDATFRERVERFLTQSGMTATAFSRAAAGDPSFVLKLRRGRSPRLETADRIERYMANWRPDRAA